MLVLGLVLLVLGAILVLSGLFASGTEAKTVGGTTDVHTTFLGIDMPAETLFLIGVASAVLVLGGLWLSKVGARQEWRRRKDRRRLDELSQKLDRSESERRDEGTGNGNDRS
ncbi:hypothetical protein E8D34_13505 [Nocardioides sp. GY 10113]|uniref:hypothetical protein n=1 Tax=Nocardioides sp. GY 10113 TaxID=2569761 RepID=UPI0010A8B708|nr:hypothetical protein [Nocardioides sp. GY 10113]TIC85083.1 hypothetical protein E8D34_13505 [Nocardioides sp. GY 10113]